MDFSALVDERELVFENYEEGALMAKVLGKLPQKMRDVIILPKDEVAKGNLLFFETVARNRGVNVWSFDTRDDALAWLLSD